MVRDCAAAIPKGETAGQDAHYCPSVEDLMAFKQYL